MNYQTEEAVYKLKKLIPASPVIHIPRIEYVMDALLASAAREQVNLQRIAMLEAENARLRIAAGITVSG